MCLSLFEILHSHNPIYWFSPQLSPIQPSANPCWLSPAFLWAEHCPGSQILFGSEWSFCTAQSSDHGQSQLITLISSVMQRSCLQCKPSELLAVDCCFGFIYILRVQLVVVECHPNNRTQYEGVITQHQNTGQVLQSDTVVPGGRVREGSGLTAGFYCYNNSTIRSTNTVSVTEPAQQ